MNGEEPRILVVVPFYNNGRTVASVVSEITALGWPLLVINDGSTDGGPDSLKGLPRQLASVDPDYVAQSLFP